MRYGISKKNGPTRTGRSHFISVLKECLEMLECLGVPWVQAAGEAEAMCAYLNANGYVDGCITNDGDVFLYGAQTVYRNFTMNAKDPHVDCYKMSSIKERLGFDRDKLIGLGVLLGCDYLPKGVPGVGKEQAIKLIESLKGQSLLERFRIWEKQFQNGEAQLLALKKITHCSVCCHPGSAKDHKCNGCKLCGSARYCEPHDYNYQCPCDWHHMEHMKQASAAENSIKKKAGACVGFPFHEVIQEFVITKDKVEKRIKWQRPSLLAFQKFALKMLDWPQHYSCEKVLVLLTHYDMFERKSGQMDMRQLQAIRIIKTRVRSGVPCFEVEWEKPEHYVYAEGHPLESQPVTVEEESLFRAAYPDIVVLFERVKLNVDDRKHKSKKTKIKGKQISELDSVVDQLAQMKLKYEEKETITSLDSEEDLKIILNGRNLQKPLSSCDDSSYTVVSSRTPGSLPNAYPVYVLDSAKSTRMFDDPLSPSVQFSKQPLHVSSPDTSFLISEMQLSNIDWEATSFSCSPQMQSHINPSQILITDEYAGYSFNNCTSQCQCRDISDIAAIRSGPRIQTSRCSPKFSSSVDTSVVAHFQTVPLKERNLLKNAFQCGTSHPRGLFASTTGLLTKQSFVESKRESSNPGTVGLPVLCSSSIVNIKKDSAQSDAQKEMKNCEAANMAVQAPEYEKPSSSAPRAVWSVHPGKFLSWAHDPQKESTDFGSGIVKPKISLKQNTKKSVCHVGYSSSEESDKEDINSELQLAKVKQRSIKMNPAQCKKMSSKKLGDNGRGLEASQGALIEQSCDRTGNWFADQDAAVLQTSISVHNSSSAIVHFQNSKERVTRCDSPLSPVQEHAKDDSVLSEDSPLPLSERLKLRLQSS
nr:flap endonuclease GEN homolog 1 isoform X2 [Geotrypetes seraphini]